ncbi:hypothetical protein QE152_g22866 [Popillia japonica]|uniref:Uncharacterized protein n=1 Tax=Popillia japonica TaxID=7064 RepID=A0AAW1KHC2_POPJA
MIHGPISTKSFYDNPIPSCSQSTPSCASTARTFTVTPEQVIPIPHSERKIHADDKRRGKTAVLSSTPYKEELERSITVRQKKIPKRNLAEEASTNSNKKIRKRVRHQNIKKIPRRVKDNSSSSEGAESTPKYQKNTKKSKRQQ